MPVGDDGDMGECTKAPSAMTREELEQEVAAGRSGSTRGPARSDHVRRHEFRLALSIAALVVTLIFGGGAFFYGQLLSLRDTIENRNDGLRETILERTDRLRETIESGDDELRDAIGSRLDADDQARILERIDRLDRDTRAGIDELNLDTDELRSGTRDVNQRLLQIEFQIAQLLEPRE